MKRRQLSLNPAKRGWAPEECKAPATRPIGQRFSTYRQLLSLPGRNLRYNFSSLRMEQDLCFYDIFTGH